MSKKIIGLALLGSSVWGAGIHSDHNGVNGATSEALLAILIHRTKVLNDNFPCDENKRAITYMENALALFEQRTKDRQGRGVEGFNKV